MTEEVIFKPGDVVLLKSGSRWMTVHKVNDDATVEVVWLPWGSAEFQYDTLSTNVLKKR